jgi:VanZ family protein
MRTYRIILLLTLIAYWGMIFVLTHVPAEKLPHVGVSDKTAHFLGYGTLAALFYLTIWAYRPEFRYAWVVVALVALGYGAMDEVLQSFVGRSCDFRDWLADATGTFLAIVAVWAVRRFAWNRAVARQRDAWKVRERVHQHAVAGDPA